MSYWTVVPQKVRRSKILTAEEKELFYEISDNLTAGGYCDKTNEELAQSLNTTEKTIKSRLAKLREKHFANTFIETRRHRRRIYLNVPGEPSLNDEPKPDEDDSRLKTKMDNLEESLKKTLILGDIEFDTLIARIKESGYLEDLKDNNIQFCLTPEQSEFYSMFKALYPNRIDCQICMWPEINYHHLLNAMTNSDLLAECENITLKWVLEHSNEIISGKYRRFKNPNTPCRHIGRNYTREEMNARFQSIDEIEV